MGATISRDKIQLEEIQSVGSVPSPKIKWYKKNNILLSLLIIILGLYFLLCGIIMLKPHKLLNEKDYSELTEDERKVKNTYSYQHEFGGDRKLRIITGYVLISMFVICLILACLIFLGTTENLEFTNSKLKIAVIIFTILLVICFIYYGVYKKGMLNKKQNEIYDASEKEKSCKAEGVSIIYNNCINKEMKFLKNIICVWK